MLDHNRVATANLVIVLGFALTSSACRTQPQPIPPAPRVISVGDAMDACGRVASTGQDYSVAARVRQKKAKAAFITAAFGVVGTLATSIVGATTEDKAATGVTGAGAIALTGIGVAVATLLDSTDDLKADTERVQKLKEDAEKYWKELETKCLLTPGAPGCVPLAAGLKARCESLSHSLPFEP